MTVAHEKIVNEYALLNRIYVHTYLSKNKNYESFSPYNWLRYLYQLERSRDLPLARSIIVDEDIVFLNKAVLPSIRNFR